MATSPMQEQSDGLDAVLDAFASVHSDTVRVVERRVVGRRRLSVGRVGIVVGGAGPAPSYARWVGDGFADTAAIGGATTPPASATCLRAIRAASRGQGVVVVTGNRQSDVLNFGLAATAAVEEGIDVRLTRMTDDVASAPPSAMNRRIGLSGTMVAVKAAGAAAARGDGLAGVERIVAQANALTRSAAFRCPSGSLITDTDEMEGLRIEAVEAVRRILGDQAPASTSKEVLMAMDVCGTCDPRLPYLIDGATRREVEGAGFVVDRTIVGRFASEVGRAVITITRLEPFLRVLMDAPAQCVAWQATLPETRDPAGTRG